jgi:hypothetical protein
MGDTGPQGPQGPTGDTGPTGPTGATGHYGPGLPLFWYWYYAFNYSTPLSTYNNSSYTNVIAYTNVIPVIPFEIGSYITINWTLMEEIGLVYAKSYSSIYIDFIAQNTLVVYTPVTVNSVNGGAIGEYIQSGPGTISQSVSVNDFVDLTGYNINTSGQLYLRIWQLGESGALTAIDVLKIAFYADWSAITTNSQTTGITGPTSITAVQGPHP